MACINRKTAPGVRNGRVQKKNRVAWLPNYRRSSTGPVVDCRHAGAGYRHVVFKQDVRRFISILPNWSELSQDLRAIVLAPGDEFCDGWYRSGVIAICAWQPPFAFEITRSFFDAHREILDRVGVDYWFHDGHVQSRWSESAIRAYLLTHVFLHELGHHRDHQSRRPRKRVERFAERFALELANRVWNRYLQEFGHPKTQF